MLEHLSVYKMSASVPLAKKSGEHVVDIWPGDPQCLQIVRVGPFTETLSAGHFTDTWPGAPQFLLSVRFGPSGENQSGERFVDIGPGAAPIPLAKNSQAVTL